MKITIEMWEKSLKNHYKILNKLKNRNDIDDKFHIEQHKKAILEIYQEMDKIIINNTDIHINKKVV